MYFCQFCDYSTSAKSQIHSHHIIPLELNGSNKISNRVYCCPNCHSKIYIQTSSKGIHSIKTNDYIEIIRWHTSTTGRLLECYISGEHTFLIDKIS